MVWVSLSSSFARLRQLSKPPLRTYRTNTFPNAKQRGKYLKTREAAQKTAESKGEPLGSGWADASQLHCVMVFDVATHESVGTDCYVVAELPKVGDIFTYDTYPAEFVATSAEFVAH
jgi:hypothetical protein